MMRTNMSIERNQLFLRLGRLQCQATRVLYALAIAWTMNHRCNHQTALDRCQELSQMNFEELDVKSRHARIHLHRHLWNNRHLESSWSWSITAGTYSIKRDLKAKAARYKPQPKRDWATPTIIPCIYAKNSTWISCTDACSQCWGQLWGPKCVAEKVSEH